MKLLCWLLTGAVLLAADLAPWTPGVLDIHQIHTGRGNAAFFVFPDGTTMLVDAGAIPDRDGPEIGPLRPNASRRAGEWVAHYIDQASPRKPAVLDYAVLTHFHDDHMGTVTMESPAAPGGGYRLAGITDVGSRIPISKMIDRGWPDYNFPSTASGPMIPNYRAFLKATGTPAERFRPGREDQIVPLRPVEGFLVRNVAANGEIWTGAGTETKIVFPADWRKLPADEQPSENECSIALRIQYGPFDYFTGGDIPGFAGEGLPTWHDLETPVAQAIGAVDVAVLNHHGWLDSTNNAYLTALRPRVFVLAAWHATHPDHGVLRRLLSTRLYPGPRDLFATSLLDAPRTVFSYMGNRFASTQGHVLVRVAPGGESYQVLILDDASETLRVTATHGPYRSR